MTVLWHSMSQRSSPHHSDSSQKPPPPYADAGQRSPHFKQMWVSDHSHSHRFRSKVTIISADEGQWSLLTLCRFPWAPQSLFLELLRSASEVCSQVSLSCLSGTCLLRESHRPWQSLVLTNGHRGWAASMAAKCEVETSMASMLSFTVAALGMFSVPLEAGACAICHQSKVLVLPLRGQLERTPDPLASSPHILHLD